MTIHEAAARLELSHTACVQYAQRIGLKPVWRVTSRNAYFAYDFTEADLKAIAAERRRRQFAHSEAKSKNLQRVAVQYRDVAKAKRDPEERKRSLAKAVTAAAEKRRRLREWRDRHDLMTYTRFKPEFRKHPWRAAADESFAKWSAKHNRS